MPDPNSDDTPFWSRRQLIQSAGQFVVTFLTLVSIDLAGQTPTLATVGLDAVKAAIVALGVLGFSYLPPK